MNVNAHCARCMIAKDERVCLNEGGRGPKFCPTLNYPELVPRVLEEYKDQSLNTFARMACIQESECYLNRKPGPYVLQPSKCRIQETIELSQKMGFRKLGLGFCGGLAKEAGLLTDILESHGFEVASVTCNAGGIPKEAIGLREEEKVKIGSYETMCNPLLQAEVLNQEKTEFNIVLGLCVGHDSIFLKKADALCTVLAAKDRVTGHNPLAALYTLHSYYQKLKK
jgi:uncharacterized metal-binding protein